MGEKVVVFDRGNLEFLYPNDWHVARNKDGYITLSDPTESCRLEVSYTTLPSGAGEIAVEELLKRLLSQVPEAGAETPIETISDANRRIAWADYAYPSTHKRTGEPSEAHGRWLVGSNGLFQLLMTFYYWADDASWATRVWERVVETVQFGDGSQLQSPEEHWSMRRQN